MLPPDVLLQHLAGFLAYEWIDGEMCLVEWIEAKGFGPSERAYLETTYLAATELTELRA